jgi:DNA-directed RNA polymerase subunit F
MTTTREERAATVPEVRPIISEEEKQRRQEAMNYATASVELEGFKISEADEQHAQRFINGEITLEQFVTAGLPL